MNISGTTNIGKIAKLLALTFLSILATGFNFMLPKHVIFLSEVFAFLITAIIIYFIILFSNRFRALLDDPVDNSKTQAIHNRPIPTSGGIAIFLGFWLTFLIFLPHLKNQVNLSEMGVIFLITLIMTSIGAVDDASHVRARYKLLIEILAGIGIYYLVRVKCVDFGILCLNLGILTPFLFAFFFAGVVNCINFMDGVDGLAGGIAAIALFVIIFLGYITGNYIHMLLAGVLMISVISFLLFNFSPAKIFMGDAGTMFLGSMIAYLSLYVGIRESTFYIYPFLVVLFIPILDVSWAIIRRLIKRKNIFYPDKEHIHHKLVGRGLTVRESVLLLWFLTGILGILAIYSTYYGFIPKLIITIILLLIWGSGGWIFGWI